MTTITPAMACYTVTLKNESQENIRGLWGAQGCAKIYDNEAPVLTEICTNHSIDPGKSNSYNYKWGTTAPTLWVTFHAETESGNYNHLRRYIYKDGKFKHNVGHIPGTVPSCGRSYSVTFTQADYDAAKNKRS
ncbi:MAG: hypothetical protein AAFX54_03025 [Pseudomonadota bacterium]